MRAGERTRPSRKERPSDIAVALSLLVRFGSVEINGAVRVAHVERDSLHVVETQKSCGKDMLTGMLLHVIAAALRVDLAANPITRLHFLGRRFEIMDHLAVFRIRNLGHAHLGAGIRTDPTGVEDLHSARGIKGGAVENQRWAWRVDHISDFCVEVV